MKYKSSKIIELGSCAFRQWKADSHCKYIHGYRLLAKFTFGCSGLDDKNWVVDFGGLKELKALLEKQFDHTLVVSADDPHLEKFKELNSLGICDLRIMEKGVGIERFTEYCFNIADQYIREKTTSRCWVERVEVWEHEKNSASIEYNLGDILPSKTDPKDVKQGVEDVEPESANVMQPAPTNQPKPAAVGNKVTTGWSNPFGGTSWGV
jgi:6-pyruvoyltetrahydropterin/6-carboxytetrahydropterin synthase